MNRNKPAMLMDYLDRVTPVAGRFSLDCVFCVEKNGQASEQAVFILLNRCV